LIDRTFIGLIAQEVEQTAFSNIVGTDPDGYKTVDSSEIIFALVNAVKELSTEVNILKTKVANLEAQ
jgi:sugar (pentulose or hexulose) kinase